MSRCEMTGGVEGKQLLTLELYQIHDRGSGIDKVQQHCSVPRLITGINYRFEYI